jgi:cytochrome P450
MHAIARWPVLSASMKYLMPPSVKKLRESHFRYCMDQVDKRMAVKTDRSDFWSLIIRAGAERDISKSQLYATMSDFMIAGTETTATLLSGLTYYLCKNPEKMARLVDEIRQFRTYDDLTLGSLQALPYLAACIEEGLRMYPPVPVGTMRLAPAEGAVVCGRWVPGGV